MIGESLRAMDKYFDESKLLIKYTGGSGYRHQSNEDHKTQSLLILAALRDPDPIRKQRFLRDKAEYLKKYVMSCQNWEMRNQYEPYDAAYSLRTLVALRNFWPYEIGQEKNGIDKSIQETISSLIKLQDKDKDKDKDKQEGQVTKYGFWDYGTDRIDGRDYLHKYKRYWGHFNGSVTLTVISAFKFCRDTLQLEGLQIEPTLTESLQRCNLIDNLRSDSNSGELEFRYDIRSYWENLGVTALSCMEFDEIIKNDKLNQFAKHNLVSSGDLNFLKIPFLTAPNEKEHRTRLIYYPERLFNLSELLQKIEFNATSQKLKRMDAAIKIESCLTTEFLAGSTKYWWETVYQYDSATIESLLCEKDPNCDISLRVFKILACENYYSCLTPVMQSAQLVLSENEGARLFIHFEGAPLKGTIFLVPQKYLKNREVHSVDFNNFPRFEIGKINPKPTTRRIFRFDIQQGVIDSIKHLKMADKDVEWTVWFKQDTEPLLEAWSFLYE